jgi:hypothetical protein
MKNIFRAVQLSIALLVLPLISIASEATDTFTYYQYVSEVPPVQVPVPTLVELTYADADIQNASESLVYEVGSDRLIPATVVRPSTRVTQPKVTVSRNSGTAVSGMTDDDAQTFYVVEAYPQGTIEGDVWISTILLSWNTPATVQDVLFALTDDSSVPTKVSIVADGVTVVPWTAYTGKVIPLDTPRTVSRLEIRFEHRQEVRIAEVDVVRASVSEATRIQFLMQPNENYRVYADVTEGAPRNTLTRVVENKTIESVQYIGALAFGKNTTHEDADFDGDGVSVSVDNCAEHANTDQTDLNKNNIGDACEDFDKDNVVNAIDNCPDRPNGGQEDADDDGIGDECDPEESRLTEQYAWVPLAGVLVAVLVLVVLFISVSIAARRISARKTQEGSGTE